MSNKNDYRRLKEEADIRSVVEYCGIEKGRRIGSAQFVKCNRNYLVNLRYVEAVRDGLCVLAGDELIISRPQKKKFIQALQDYMCGGRNYDV